MEQFFISVFEHAPAGSFFYGNRIYKPGAQAHPQFYIDPADLWADVKDHRETDVTDFYFSPAFYLRRTNATKSNVRGAGVAWVDCDAGLPKFDQEPNFILETSPEHYHCYWLLGEMRTPNDVESINKTLAYTYKTDKSGWDSTQLLRPPLSYNRKRDNFRTRICRSNTDSHATFTAAALVHNSEVDRGSVGEGGHSSIEQILATEVFTKSITSLIFEAIDTKTGAGRSGVIFNLACELIRMGMKSPEILTVLLFTDDRLGKYTKHSDRIGTLQGVIVSARAETKTPEPKAIIVRSPFTIYTGEELATAVEEEKFLCQNLVFEEGILIAAGEPGAGKSRFILNLADCLASGKEFIGLATGDPILCCYMTIEMTARRVRGIRQQQLAGFDKEYQALIMQNVKIITVTPGTNLADPKTQEEATEKLLQVGAKFIVIDSISRAIPDMSNDELVVPFLDWTQRYIKETGASFGFVGHTRKAQVGNKSATGLDDLYGSRHWSITPDTVFVLENEGRGKQSILHISKDRSGELGERILVMKDSKTSLHTLVTSEASKPDDKEGVVGQSGFGT